MPRSRELRCSTSRSLYAVSYTHLDKDKDKYLKTQFANIVNRSDDADLKLKELMLACCNKDNNMIYYTDKLQVRNQGGIQTVSNDLGKTTYALSRMDERLSLIHI